MVKQRYKMVEIIERNKCGKGCTRCEIGENGIEAEIDEKNTQRKSPARIQKRKSSTLN